MKYILRKYQEDAVKSGLDFMQNKKEMDGAIIIAPTGSGKALIIASIAKKLEGNTLVLQPSLEILNQNLEKAKAFGITDIGVYSASANRKDIGKITFATIGSIIRKKHLFDNFHYLIIDECHLVNAKGGMLEELINYMGGKCLGLTATPYRLYAYSDFKTGQLSVVAKFLHRTRPRLFSKIIHITQIQELYKQGYLCPIQYEINPEYHHSELKLNSTGMNFDEDSVLEYNSSHQIVSKVSGLISNEDSRHILVFMSSVEEATRISEYLTLINITSAVVSAKTPKKERAEILEKFKSGEIRVVSNFGTLTVGYDFPELDCVILGRPTQSVALFYQMMGRGIRTAPGKQKVKVIDICGNVNRFGKIEEFEITEDKPNMHRLKSDTSYLTGYCFYSNQDLEAQNYAGKKETEWKRCDDIIHFGKHKGLHVAKVPQDYLVWCIGTFTGKWKEMFEKEFKRREDSRQEVLEKEKAPF